MFTKVLCVFQKFKLQHQLMLLTFLSAAIPSAAVGLMGTISATRSLSIDAGAMLQEEVEDEFKAIDAFLESVSRDVTFLSKIPAIQGIVRARANDGTDPEDNISYDARVTQLQSIFASKIEEKPYYAQIRYLDEAGNEIVRVDSKDDQPLIIPASQLENDADDIHFDEIMALPSGSLFVSPVELSRNCQVIKEPHMPIVEYAIAIQNSAGQKKGTIIVDVLASQFIDSFAYSTEGEEGHEFEDESFILANHEGYYLSHPNAEKAWGFDLNKDETLANDYSPEVAEQILNSGSGVLDLGDSILGFHRLTPTPAHPYDLITINSVPKRSIFASVNAFKVFAATAILLSLGVALPVAVFWGRQLAKKLEGLASGISTSSREMAITIAEQERIASQQASSVNETTATMDELEASFRHSSEMAKAAVEAAKDTFSASEDGAQAVSESMDGMLTLEQKVEAISAQIINLSSLANQIGSISRTVSEFANQTNMLALNSSVEAVHAGEHGRGFAIVANEIRKLADQSQKSADKINTLVSAIQQLITEAVMVTEEGTKTVKTEVQITKRTETAFGKIQHAVNQVVLNNQQVSLNLRQQLDAIQQVADAMDNLNQGAKENAAGLDQTRSGTETLNRAVVALQQTV
ncbi:MAG: methyl-accepting chemotaxis protein [Cyanobacteria bacterium J06636_16]